MANLSHFTGINKEDVKLLSLIVLGILLAWSPLPFISLTLSVFLWAIFFRPLRIISTLLSRLVIGFLLLTCIQHILGIIFWLVDSRLTIAWVIIAQGLILLICRLIFKQYHSAASKDKLFDKSDMVAMLVAIFSVVILFVGTVRGAPLTQQLFRYFVTGFDHTAHLSLTLSVFDEEGLIYGESEEKREQILYRNFNAYPQGWHLNNAIMMRSVFPDGISTEHNLREVLLSYFVILLLWYGVVIFLFCKASYLIVRKMNRLELNNFGFLFIAIFGILAQILIITGLIRHGFGNYLLQVAYVITLTIIILNTSQLVSGKSYAKKIPLVNQFVILGFLISAGMAVSWMLTAAVGYAMTALAAYVLLEKRPLQFVAHFIRRPVLLITLAALAAVNIVQIFVWLNFAKQDNHLNAIGGGEPINNIILFSCLVFCAVVYLFGRFKRLGPIFAASTVGVMLLSGSIYWYQFVTARTANYYSIKTGQLAFIVLLMFTAAAAAYYASNAAFNNKVAATLSILALFLFLPQAAGLQMPTLAYALGSYRIVSPYTASQVLTLMSTDRNITKANIAVFKELDYEEDLITTHFVKMLSRTNPDCQNGLVGMKMVGLRQEALERISECAREQSNEFFVIASSKNHEELTNYFRSEPLVRVILSN